MHHVTSHCICKYAWVSIPKECLANAGFAYAESAYNKNALEMLILCIQSQHFLWISKLAIIIIQ